MLKATVARKSGGGFGLTRLKPVQWNGPVRAIALEGEQRVHESIVSLVDEVVDEYRRKGRVDAPIMVQPCRIKNGKVYPKEHTFIDLRDIWKGLGVQ